MRIAHVTATFPPYHGGTGNVAWHNALGLARLGHDVHVFTAAPKGASNAALHARLPRGADEDPPGVRVHRLQPLLRTGNAPLLPGLLPALRGFDLIHLHYPFFFGAELVWLAARLFRVPYVVTYHQDVLLAGTLRHVPGVHHRFVGRRILAGARRLLFTTLDYGRTSFARELAAAPTAGELPNAVDAVRFAPSVDGSTVRVALGVAPGEVLVLCVAALDKAHYFKGMDVLLEAFATQPSGTTKLAVVGDGDLRDTYEQTARRLGLADRVQFTGPVDDATLPHYYAEADLAVLPSVTRGEAFGLVLLEAMACGTPVVATNLPGVRAVVGDTGGGLLVPPGDAAALGAAIAALAADPERRAALGLAGRTAVEQRYSWDAIVRRLEQIYRDVTCTVQA